MLLTVDIESKTIGSKELFKDLHLIIEPREKVAVIGRNGVGKTTLFGMLNGHDKDYNGNLQIRQGIRMVSTAQEHHGVAHESVLHYVLFNLPEYGELKHILDTYPETMGDNMRKIETYSTALERFSDLDYYNVEEKIIRNLEAYQINQEMAGAPMARLSGGQKRFVELVRVEQADADLALIDEPTNHMDYVAKQTFIEWLKASQQTVVVISHDRDVLQWVDKIIEIKDGKAVTFKGNYEAYLSQNAHNTAANIHDYEIALKTMDNLQKKILWARSRKPSWHGTADQSNPFVVMERRLQKEFDEIKANNQKPNFWIDRESAEALGKKASDNYDKFKSKNIRLHATKADSHASELLHVEALQLGYTASPLFTPLNFRMQHGDRIRLIGRNGAGKTTLVKAIVSASQDTKPATLLTGAITCTNKLRLSVYEQELPPEVMQLTLADTIEKIYLDLDIKVNAEIVMRVMGDYLFDPYTDGKLTVENLSGGQKARLQIIKMLAGNPNLLILDEPTNHLDLPSIEELENALMRYHGALLYVSHDSYFAKNIGGDELHIKPAA
jgi:ATP-binding cassette subfamily F protein 3